MTKKNIENLQNKAIKDLNIHLNLKISFDKDNQTKDKSDRDKHSVIPTSKLFEIKSHRKYNIFVYSFMYFYNTNYIAILWKTEIKLGEIHRLLSLWLHSTKMTLTPFGE